MSIYLDQLHAPGQPAGQDPPHQVVRADVLQGQTENRYFDICIYIDRYRFRFSDNHFRSNNRSISNSNNSISINRDRDRNKSNCCSDRICN